MSSSSWAALAIAVSFATIAQAEQIDTVSSRPKFQNLPFEEDWSVLREGVEPTSVLDPIKYFPLSQSGDYWMSFGGQLRGRGEFWNGFLFGDSVPEDSDAFFLSRIRLHTDIHLTAYLRVFAEFKSSLSTNRELSGGERGIDADAADLQNGFAEIRLPIGEAALVARGGRQELQFGAQRLVSPLDWANTRRTFDGALAYGKGEGWKLTGFWSRPVRVEKYEFNESDPSLEFFGIYSELAIPVEGVDFDLYWLGIHFDEMRPANRIPGDGARHTVGGRLHGVAPGTPLVFDLEGAVQVGHVGDTDILAGMAAVKLMWPFSAPLAPSVEGGYDWASGDSGPDGKVGTFDQLFPLGHAYLGFIDAVGRQNIHAVHFGGKFSPIEKSAAALTLHSFWLADRNDALYAASGSPIRFDPTASSKHVGVELDLKLTYEFVRGLVGVAGYSHFFTGRFIEQSGSDDDTDFGYLQLQYTF